MPGSPSIAPGCAFIDNRKLIAGDAGAPGAFPIPGGEPELSEQRARVVEGVTVALAVLGVAFDRPVSAGAVSTRSDNRAENVSRAAEAP